MPWKHNATIVTYDEPLPFLLGRVGPFERKGESMYVRFEHNGKHSILTVVQEVTRGERSSARVYVIAKDEGLASLILSHFLSRTKAVETIVSDEDGNLLAPQNDKRLAQTAADIAQHIGSYI